MSDIVKRLRAAIDLGEKTGSRGKHPSNIYNLAEEATDRIEALEAALTSLLRGEYESAEPGLCDCIDNDGNPYQSQWLAKKLSEAEALVATSLEQRLRDAGVEP